MGFLKKWWFLKEEAIFAKMADFRKRWVIPLFWCKMALLAKTVIFGHFGKFWKLMVSRSGIFFEKKWKKRKKTFKKWQNLPEESTFFSLPLKTFFNFLSFFAHVKNTGSYFNLSLFWIGAEKRVKKPKTVFFKNRFLDPFFQVFGTFWNFGNLYLACLGGMVILVGTIQRVSGNGPKMAQKWPFLGFLEGPKTRFCMVFMHFHVFGKKSKIWGFFVIFGDFGDFGYFGKFGKFCTRTIP